ncbi:MAG: hypothetical protein PHN49_04225 [Candidatus Omnitrophica bacterium]|nr:hypothetical protein [Candidatus Omnitrophota bacterium]MDD5670828.1 hypothetical protein [Candidatus Omnitrophota bacterium]
MKELENYLKKIESVLDKHKQYKFEAYSFVMAALHHTVSKLPKARHISGKELLEGIRDYALEQFGPMARTVLNYWGIQKTEDFGTIVFALVEVGILRKQPEDKLDDFKDVYQFEDAFDKGYQIRDD